MSNRLPLLPQIDGTQLTRSVTGTDHLGRRIDTDVVEERPLTIYLNSRDIVTAMTIGDYPDLLALGFLRNQRLLSDKDQVTGVEYDDDLGVVVVRTETETNHEAKLARKTRTSGCAVGTVFGDMMDGLEDIRLPASTLRVSQMYSAAKTINTMPSLYLKAGAIHGTVLCKGSSVLAYMEDVGRHNAVDKIAGLIYRDNIRVDDCWLYTTGRLTSEMVIKCANMGIPIVASRSGFTAWGVDLALQTGLTLIGRLRGQRFMCLSGGERLVRDVDIEGSTK